MRFLFGILTGAALTLLVATTANAPSHPVLTGIASGWQAFIEATGKLVFPQPPQSPAAPALTKPPVHEPAQAAIPATPPTPAALASTEPEPEQDQDASLELSGIEVISDDAVADETAAQTGTDEAPVASNDSTAVVWTPFHSERSAEGFAHRLSQQMAHPFTVQRRGPGAYQVTFAYASIDERDALLEEIAEITGQ